jgi:outer membrane protein TolC
MKNNSLPIDNTESAVRLHPQSILVMLFVFLLYQLLPGDDTVSSFPSTHALSLDNKLMNNELINSKSVSDTTVFINLTIDDAVAYLIHNNSDIRKAYFEWKASQSRLFGSYGTFEPVLVGNVKHESTNRTNALFSQMQTVYSSGIEGLLPSSTKYELNLSTSDLRYRFSDNTDLPYTSLNFSLTQPILKGLWFGKPVLDIKVARADKQIALHKFRATLFSKIFELEIAYWKLCLAQEKRSNAVHSVSIVQEIYDDSKLQLRFGKISEIDRDEASAALAARQNDFNDITNDLYSAINELKLLISGPGIIIDTMLKATSSIALDSSEQVIHFPTDTAIHFTLLQPDYLQKKAENEREKLSVDYQSSQCLPDLNFKYSYGYMVNGRELTIAWEKFLNNNYRRKSGFFRAEIEFRIPLGMNIRERKLLDAEKKILLSTEVNLSSIQTQIENFIITSRKRLPDLLMNLKNAQIIIDYRTAQLTAEISKQKAGKSNYRKIFELEEELTKSKIWKIENLIDYHTLQVQLSRLNGTLLIENKLETFDNNAFELHQQAFGDK